MLRMIASTIILTGKNCLDILNKTPLDIQPLILEYADKFETKTIIPLLE
jgi:hypothetical protein